MKHNYRFSVGKSDPWEVQFESDKKAFDYATGADDEGRCVIEKQIDGVWHGWDSSTQRWVSKAIIWKAEANDMFEKLVGGVSHKNRGKIQQLAELFIGEGDEVTAEHVCEAVNAFLRGLSVGGR